ncbi:Elongator complex protein 5, partial [Microtus ochrogaster]
SRLLGRDDIRKRPKTSEMLDSLLASGGFLLLRGADPLVEQVRVLGLLHEDLHGPGPIGALSTLAHTEVTLSGKMDQTSASILCRRPQQRATYQVDPTTHLTFNLHLSEKEREARDSLTLPFQFSSEK